MKVELSIKDDAELRFLIKDMIRGQVTSIARSDMDEIIKQVVGDKTAKLSDLMAKEITKVVKDFLMPTNHINIKELYGKIVLKTDDPFAAGGVSKAMGRLGLKFEGKPHSGGDDAYNIARIYMELMKRSE